MGAFLRHLFKWLLKNAYSNKGGMGGSSQLQGFQFYHELGLQLCMDVDVLPLCACASFWFSGFLLQCKNESVCDCVSACCPEMDWCHMQGVFLPYQDKTTVSTEHYLQFPLNRYS